MTKDSDKTAAEKADEARAAAHKAELDRQEAVRKAVYEATHDAKGLPIPIVVPEG